MAVLGGVDGVHHDGQVPAGGVLHAYGHGDAGAGEPVLLVLHGPGPHGHIGQHIVQIFVVLRVEHFIGAGEACLPQDPHMELPNGDQALQHIRGGVGVRLVEHALVACSGGPWLVGIDPGDDQQPVLHLLLDGYQPGNVIQHAVLPVCRAGPDDEGQAAVLAGEDGLQLPVPPVKYLRHLHGDRVLLLEVIGDGQLAFEIHVHDLCVLFSVVGSSIAFSGGKSKINQNLPEPSIPRREVAFPHGEGGPGAARDG